MKERVKAFFASKKTWFAGFVAAVVAGTAYFFPGSEQIVIDFFVNWGLM
jgi:hypothetical protein